LKLRRPKELLVLQIRGGDTGRNGGDEYTTWMGRNGDALLGTFGVGFQGKMSMGLAWGREEEPGPKAKEENNPKKKADDGLGLECIGEGQERGQR